MRNAQIINGQSTNSFTTFSTEHRCDVIYTSIVKVKRKNDFGGKAKDSTAAPRNITFAGIFIFYVPSDLLQIESPSFPPSFFSCTNYEVA